MANKISNVRGVQDFYGATLLQRNYIIETIKNIFILRQFSELQTPAMEYIDLLTGKYGDEGDKLLYRILNSGDFMSQVDEKVPLVRQISEKGLRYDLTVPMMRFVANNYGSLVFPWKRFQIQPVWRADRPQKGRFREFIQCDIDVIGSKSILNEIEMISIVHKVSRALGLNNFRLYINHIGIIKQVIASLGFIDDFAKIFSIIDKLDKLPIEKILEEVRILCDSENLCNIIHNLYLLRENYDFLATINYLKKLNSELEIGNESLDEIEKLFSLTKNLEIENDFVVFDPVLARGLSYYTTFVFELKPLDKSIGSVVGGGRYDNMLKNLFGVKLPEGIEDSGVGLSFGIDRLYAYMSEKNIFPTEIFTINNTLIVPLIEEAVPFCLSLLNIFTKSKGSSEIFLKSFRLKSALEYANKKKISTVFIIGESELSNKNVLIKNMADGSQKLKSLEEIIKFL